MESSGCLDYAHCVCQFTRRMDSLSQREACVRVCVCLSAWEWACVLWCASIWQRCIPEENVTSSGKNQHARWCEQIVKEDEEERYEETGESFINSPKTQNCQPSTLLHSLKRVCSSCNSLGTFRVTGGLWSHPGLLPFSVLVIFLTFFLCWGYVYLGSWVGTHKKGVARTCCCFRMWWRQTRAVFWFLFPQPSFPIHNSYSAFLQPQSELFKGWGWIYFVDLNISQKQQLCGLQQFCFWTY